MNCKFNPHFCSDLFFNIVDNVVTYHNVKIGRHLNVHRCKYLPRTVAVNDEVVNTAYMVIGEDFLFDFINKFLCRRCADKSVERALEDVEAGFQNEAGNNNSEPAVDVKRREEF